VADPNNATDGDLYIAFGLLMAHARWRHAPYRDLAIAIGRDLLRLTLRHRAGQPLLLPGASGFESPAGLVINPSYMVFPAFTALERAMPHDPWGPLGRASLALLDRARFGAWGLPPDWVLQPAAPDAAPRIAGAWPPRFSFDAVRVPLLLAWAGETAHPALRGALSFWADPRWEAPPAWVDLVTGQAAGFAVSPGVAAIRIFATARIGAAGAAVALPSVNASGDYYSAALTLLTRVACDATGISVA
jgi:endo-1,4-beta-D-glucanase Y